MATWKLKAEARDARDRLRQSGCPHVLWSRHELIIYSSFLGELPRTPLRRSSNREGHSPGPFNRAPPNRSAHLYSVKLGLCGLPEASQPPIPPFICANLISGASVLPR